MTGIAIIPNLFDPSECEDIIRIIEEEQARSATIMESREIMRKYGAKIMEKLPKYLVVVDGTIHLEELSDQFTLGRQKRYMERHTDQQVGKTNLLKLTVFLNKPTEGGGLNFDHQYIPCTPGEGILFDIRMPHQGEFFPNDEIKFVFGARIKGFKTWNDED